MGCEFPCEAVMKFGPAQFPWIWYKCLRSNSFHSKIFNLTRYRRLMVFDETKRNETSTCVAFKRLLRCRDDRSLPLVEKICDSMGFRAANRLRIDKVRTTGVFLCCLYFVLWREWQGSNSNSQKKPTKSMNSHQKTQAYIKGKSPLFIL